RYGCEIVAVDKRAQVLKQRTHELRRGRDVGGTDRVEVVAADPVLAGPDHAGDLSVLGEAQECAMDVLEVGYGKGTLARADGDRTFHRRDVAQYLGGTPIALPGLRRVRGRSQSLVRQVDALDPR